MAERVIRVAIDSVPAEAGARRVVRSLEEIGRKSREAAIEIGEVETAVLRLGRAAASMERARPKTSGDAERLDAVVAGALPTVGPGMAGSIPGGAGLENGLGGRLHNSPALRQTAAGAASPIAKGLAELLFTIIVELIAEEVSQQIRAGLEADTKTPDTLDPKPNAEQLEELSEELQEVRRRLERYLASGGMASVGLMQKLGDKEADLLRRIEAIKAVIDEERAAARENAVSGAAQQPLEGTALLVNVLQEGFSSIQSSLLEILRLMQELHDKASLECPAASTNEINDAIGRCGLPQPAAAAFSGEPLPHGGIACPVGSIGAGVLSEHSLALEETISLLARLSPEIEAAATAQNTLNLSFEEGVRGGRELGEGARRAFADYAEAATNTGAQIRQAIGGALSGLEDALVGFVQTGKLEWKSLVDAMIADLIRLFIRSQILGPLARGLGGWFGGGSGAQFTGTGAAGLAASGSFAQGGVVEQPTAFPMAHGIGLMGEAGPEAILPLRRLPGGDLGVRAAAGGRAVFNQTIVNEAGVEIETEQKQNATGGIDQLLVLVRRDAEQQMMTGQLGRVAAQRFGLSDRPIGR